MKRIGGNITCVLERSATSRNAIGETVKSWEPVLEMRGFLDMLSGAKGNQALAAFVEDSTHVFICDCIELPDGTNPENSRIVCEGKAYEIEYIDNPMNLGYQLEFYLRFSGWQL